MCRSFGIELGSDCCSAVLRPGKTSVSFESATLCGCPSLPSSTGVQMRCGPADLSSAEAEGKGEGEGPMTRTTTCDDLLSACHRAVKDAPRDCCRSRFATAALALKRVTSSCVTGAEAIEGTFALESESLVLEESPPCPLDTPRLSALGALLPPPAAAAAAPGCCCCCCCCCWSWSCVWNRLGLDAEEAGESAASNATSLMQTTMSVNARHNDLKKVAYPGDFADFAEKLFCDSMVVILRPPDWIARASALSNRLASSAVSNSKSSNTAGTLRLREGKEYRQQKDDAMTQRKCSA